MKVVRFLVVRSLRLVGMVVHRNWMMAEKAEMEGHSLKLDVKVEKGVRNWKLVVKGAHHNWKMVDSLEVHN